MKKRVWILLIAAAVALAFTACGGEEQVPAEEENAAEQEAGEEAEKEEEPDGPEEASPDEDMETEEETEMRMTIGETPVTVAWEENESVEALKALTAKEPLTIEMSMYGGFEQVGAIGHRLPSSDVQTKTKACDIVLYSGDQLVVFYGANSWAYTRLGRVTDKTPEEMAELLGNGDVTITIEGGER